MPTQSVTERPRIGFFGKLPTKGDFVTRRLTRGFTDPWDRWLQNAIADSRRQLGDGWLDSYLISPMWRFALSPGVCGEGAWCGVLMPSVDRVGRYFPLTLAQPMDGGMNAVSLFTEASDWFSAVEDLALAALNEELDLARFDERLAALDLPMMSRAPRFKVPRSTDPHLAWELPVPPGGQRQALGASLTDLLLRRICGAYSLWCTKDDDGAGSSLLVSQGLPTVERFAAMIDGKWEDWGWERCSDLTATIDTSVVPIP